MSEDDLFIQQINEKQLEAFRKLFRELYRSLAYFAVTYVDRKDTAEDIVQEVLVHVWESPQVYPSYNSLKTFLYTSVRNACLDYCRHKKVENRYLEYAEIWNSQEEDLEWKIMQEELYRLLLKLVEELPDRCKEIFKLHMEGVKNEEIADLLKLSVETVKTQKKKAMAYLRKRSDGLYDLFLFFGLI